MVLWNRSGGRNIYVDERRALGREFLEANR
jgi:hypothetical protein